MLRSAWTALLRRHSSASSPTLRVVSSSNDLSATDESASEIQRNDSDVATMAGLEDQQSIAASAPSLKLHRSKHPRPSPIRNHRGRILAMRLVHSRLCSAQRAERLEAIGVLTLGDLAYGDLQSIASHFNATAKALKQLQRYRRAVRLAASVPSLTPADALALVSIHRPHPKSLAAQTPAMLRQDLLRFANSTRGQSMLRGRPVPSIRRIKRWIAGAGEVVVA